jgi:hypothetical protein
LDFLFTIGLIELLYRGLNLQFCVTEMQRFAEEVLLVNQGLRTTCNCALQEKEPNTCTKLPKTR